MRHTTLILGAIIIFLIAGLAYTIIPEKIQNANESTDVEEYTTNDTAPSNTIDETTLPDNTDSTEAAEQNNDSDTTTPVETRDGYTLADVAEHNTESSCWSAINGNVYDVTGFIQKHPGGSRNILKICGIDGTEAFTRMHGGDSKPESTLANFLIGPLL